MARTARPSKRQRRRRTEPNDTAATSTTPTPRATRGNGKRKRNSESASTTAAPRETVKGTRNAEPSSTAAAPRSHGERNPEPDMATTSSTTTREYGKRKRHAQSNDATTAAPEPNGTAVAPRERGKRKRGPEASTMTGKRVPTPEPNIASRGYSTRRKAAFGAAELSAYACLDDMIVDQLCMLRRQPSIAPHKRASLISTRFPSDFTDSARVALNPDVCEQELKHM